MGVCSKRTEHRLQEQMHTPTLTVDDSFTDGDVSQEAEEGKAALQNPRADGACSGAVCSETELLMVLTSSDA